MREDQGRNQRIEESEDSQKEPEGKSQWDNQLQFILTALGLAVGLGNVWKFPAVAYENGGSAFLIPYLLCGIFFGLPMVYAEFTIGQFSRAGPGKALGRYASGFQGVGWSMALLSMIVAVYYCVIISWSGVYLGWIVTGNSYQWTTCGHSWNTDYCVSQENSHSCKQNGNATYFFNGTCVADPNKMVKQPAEEFFENYITKRSKGIDTLDEVIWPVAINTLMSLIGGIAAFSILGYLSVQVGKPIGDLVTSGTSLAFIVYPEAMKTMWAHYIWEFLFFLMLFFLGVSTEIALIETLIGCVYDVFPKAKKYSWAVTTGTCSIGFALGAVMVTNSGWFWFSLYSDYAGVTNCLVTAIEVLILSAYGWGNIKQDLVEMRGSPRFKGIRRWFGPQSPIFAVFWATVCPILALTVMVITFMKTMEVKVKMGKDANGIDIYYFFPTWASAIGWFLNIAQAIPIVVFFIYRYFENKKAGLSITFSDQIVS